MVWSKWTLRHPACRTALLVLFAWQWMASATFAIDISDKRWGFNGKVALSRFNPLSVLVNNSTPQPFDGDMVLEKRLGGGQAVDARIVEHVTLAPFSSKWVQFYPYINSGWNETAGNETWVLSWGRGQREELPIPRVAKYQRVILDDPGSLGSRVSVLRSMPENLFPAFVSATDALQVVAMDREPRTWIPGQKEAFLDWLSLGGTVLLMPGPSGRIPEFTGPLAVLNTPLEEGRYHSGRILKTSQQRSQFGEIQARQLFASLPKNFVPTRNTGNSTSDSQDAIDPIDAVDQSMQAQAGMVNSYNEGADPFSATSFLAQLKEMTKPEHNWMLLHLMFWVYIGMVFPGCYLLGKRWSDFRVVYGGLLGTVALFSFLFSVVGQRGYGEATAVHSVAIARALPDGGLDVSSWSNVFVTGGANYLIKHNGRGALYSTCSETEQVNGKINNGVEAEFLADIPPFSNREFALRMRMADGSPKVNFDKLKFGNGRLEECQFTVDGIKSADTQMHVLAAGHFYTVSWQNDAWKLSSDVGDASTFLKLQQMQHWSQNRGFGYNPYGESNISISDRYNQMFTPLLSRSLNVAREADVRQLNVPGDILRIYIYTKMPAGFAVQNDRLGAQEGHVLYCVDMPLQEK